MNPELEKKITEHIDYDYKRDGYVSVGMVATVCHCCKYDVEEVLEKKGFKENEAYGGRWYKAGKNA